MGTDLDVKRDKEVRHVRISQSRSGQENGPSGARPVTLNCGLLAGCEEQCSISHSPARLLPSPGTVFIKPNMEIQPTPGL